MLWTFTIEGRPVTWQRTGEHEGRRLTEQGQREAKKRIAWQALATKPNPWPMDAVYAIEVVGYWPDQRFGDADRLASLVMDALEGLAYKADRQVRVQTSTMLLDKARPRTEVTVAPYNEMRTVPVVTIALQPLPERSPEADTGHA